MFKLKEHYEHEVVVERETSSEDVVHAFYLTCLDCGKDLMKEEN